ncbi:MAG: YidC/Oxa1 family membrane protein insertase [Candidatus Paceibacterota bacterium]
MISSLFNTFVYTPLYNGLIFLLDVLPFHDLGISVVLLTIIVKFILFPLTKKSIKAQMKMREIEPELKALQAKYKDKREVLAMEMMALYRKHNFNPFAGIFLIFLQIPIILGLYFVFSGGGFPEVDTEILYSFVSAPETIDIMFLSILDITGKSIILALLAGITQYIQIKLTLPKLGKREKDATFKDDLMHSMQLQMRYVMPVIITLIAYHISAAVALYWVTSNIFTIIQEMFLRKERNMTPVAVEKTN